MFTNKNFNLSYAQSKSGQVFKRLNILVLDIPGHKYKQLYRMFLQNIQNSGTPALNIS